jgi:hypothetical protein
MSRERFAKANVIHHDPARPDAYEIAFPGIRAAPWADPTLSHAQPMVDAPPGAQPDPLPTSFILQTVHNGDVG